MSLDFTLNFFYRRVSNRDQSRNQVLQAQKVLSVFSHKFQRILRLSRESRFRQGIESNGDIRCGRLRQKKPSIESRCQRVRIDCGDLIVDITIKNDNVAISALVLSEQAPQLKRIQQV